MVACAIVVRLEEAAQAKEFVMVRRLLSLLAALLFFILAIDVVQGFSIPSPTEPTKLVYVELPTSEALVRFERSSLPAYALLTGRDGDFLLVGANFKGITDLDSLGFSYQILDENLDDASYYLAYPMPKRPIPIWQNYGRVLLDDGLHVLLRTESSDADRLAGIGVELQFLFLDPIILRPKDIEDRFPALIDPDPEIQAMMDQVISSTVYQYDGDLSGEWPVIVGGQPYTIVTRHTYSGLPIQKATEFVGEHMTDLGLDVEYHVWNSSRPPNVIGEITGETNPDEIFLITAHIDDMPPGPVAPGADDNASGSTAVLIASDIFSQHRWGCTLRFAFFTGEEQGLIGSGYYAERSYQSGENIAGVLNLDMIAWNSPGSSRDIDLHARSTVPGSVAIAQLSADVIDAYNVDLIPEIISNGSGSSDHASFWQYGYAAILGIEDFGDFNPYYHTTNDLLGNMDIEYFTEFVRASIGTYAHMTACMIPSETGALEGHVSDAEGGSPITGAEILFENDSGWQATTTTDSAGYYTQTLGIGTYTVTASADGYTPDSVSGVEIQTNLVATQDFDLTRQNYYYLPIWFHEG
jgi:Zn-dependent M28 family amino/carboxypeptidase